ncbi:unnamed protein product [Arabidopsis lyrata]|nr:unnamed protein product [Arabidopsis lyrata]
MIFLCLERSRFQVSRPSFSGRASNPGGGSHSYDPFTIRPQGPRLTIALFIVKYKSSIDK